MSWLQWQTDSTVLHPVCGHTLEVRCYGPSPQQAPTLILLHEGLGCVELWRDFPTRLSALTGCGVFVYSRAGYGSSSSVSLPRPLNYMRIEAIDVLKQLLDDVGVRKTVLIGHSDGASIAAIYAGSGIDHRVRSLVLIAPHFFPESISLQSIEASRTSFTQGDLRNKLAKYHRDVDNAFRGWNEAWLDEQFKQWNISDCLDYIRVPILAIQGVNDQYGTMAQLDELDERCYCPVERVELPNCQHHPHIEQPTATLSAIQSHLARLAVQEPFVAEAVTT